MNTLNHPLLRGTPNSPRPDFEVPENRPELEEQKTSNNNHKGSANAASNVVLLPWFGFAFLFLVRGSIFSIIKAIQSEMSPASVVAARATIGALTLMVVALFCSLCNHSTVRSDLKSLMTDPKAMLNLSIMAFIKSVAPWVLLSFGEEIVDAGIASILLGVGPLVALIGTILFLNKKEVVQWNKKAAIFCAFLGVIAVFVPQIADFSLKNFFYYLLVLGAACFYGSAKVFGKYLSDDFHPVVSGLGMMTSAAIQSLIIAFIIDFHHTNLDLASLSLKAWGCLLFLGFFSAAASAIVYFWTLQKLGAVVVAFTSYIVPIVGVLEGIFILHEWVGKPITYQASEVVGCAMIFVATCLLVHKPQKKQKKLVDDSAPAAGA